MSCTPFVLYSAPGCSRIYVQYSLVGLGRSSGDLDIDVFVSIYLLGYDVSCIVLI